MQLKFTLVNYTLGKEKKHWLMISSYAVTRQRLVG
jgi:hypothetical protein